MSDRSTQQAIKGRRASVVIAGTMLAWLGINWVGPMIGLPGRYTILFDLLALVGLGMGILMAAQLWRARQE